MSRLQRCCVYVCILAAICMVWTPAARGQTATAEIAGRIMDPTGALVPQAAVEVVNLATQVKRTAQSGASGEYTVPLLEPGSYRLTVTKAGFRAAEVANITLVVNQTLAQDVTLSIGTTSQTVEVKAQAELIQAATSEIGTVVGQQVVHDLPLNGRNFTQLLTLVAGATPISTAQWSHVGDDGAASFGVPGSDLAAPSISGQWNRSILYMADGVLNTDNCTSTYAVPLVIDAIQEFKVQTHNDKAEFGDALGGVVNLVTKSGTNNLHGSAWEFVRNNWFDARDSFADEFRSSPAPFRQNEFGGTIGGPIMLPKLYNGRNRTFFFFSYEGWRYSQAAQSRFNVPTAAELLGDFSHSTLNQPIFDPATTTPDPNNPGQYLRTQFQYNDVANVIPSNRLDANTVSFLKTYAGTPNLVGDPAHNAIVSAPNISNGDQYNGRLDEQLTSKDNLFFGWSQVGIGVVTPTTVLQYGGMNAMARVIRAGWNHMFTPSLMLELRGGENERPTWRYSGQNSAGISTMLGLGFSSPGGSTFDLASPWTNYGIGTPTFLNSPTDQVSGNLIWVHHAHNFKFGLQYLHFGTDQTFPQYATFTFTNDTTNNPEVAGTTGSSLASALLGLPSTTNIFSQESILSDRVANWSEYAQDEWKLSGKVTLTYGLRYDHRRPFAPGPGNFDAGPVPDGDYWIGLNQMPGLCSVVGKAPCLPTPLADIPGGNHVALSPYGSAYGPAPQWDQWGPRVGVAWRLNDKTVVRAGYGIVYDPFMGIGQDWKGILNGWPAASGAWSNTSWNQLGQSLTPIESTLGRINTPLPTANPWTQQNWYFDPDHKDARSQQWNVEVQRQMSNNLALTAGYVGSYSDREDITGLWNTASTPGEGLAGEPYPWWGGSNFMGTSRGLSNYQALEVKLERRFSNGLNYLVSYTWSKSIDNGSSGWFAAEEGAGSGLQNYYDPNSSRSVSGYDVPHVLVMSGLYQLPFGRGMKYFNQHGAASWLIGNWQLNGIVSLRSGQPFTMTVSGNVADIGNTISWWNYGRPNLVGDPYVAKRTSEEWFNPDAFAVPVNSYGNLGRNTLWSSPVYDTDLSLFKNFPVREGINLSFRAECFNFFNIQNYAAPDALVGDPGEGRVTSNVTSPRQIQLALKLTF